MKVQDYQFDLQKNAWRVAPKGEGVDSARTLVLAFGAQEVIDNPQAISDLAKCFPKSIVLGCSTAGEVYGSTVRDHSVSVTVTKFEKTDLSFASCDVASSGNSFAAGQLLARKLKTARQKLRSVFVLSEGLNVNGSELVRGINSVLDESIVVTGGLSGDGARFGKTWVSVGDKISTNVVAAVGFYGDHIAIGHGSKGGWDKFGPERVVTRSEANVLYELDGKPALALYKEYLGDKAKDLPGSGLLFPLSMRADAKDTKYLVRTLLAVDHEKNSMTFAGDIPTGHQVQLMKADFERLIDGAALASAMAEERASAQMTGENGEVVPGEAATRDSLVLAISCVGRRLVLGERAEEEIEAIMDAFPNAANAHITGFYSYGEISPYMTGHCDLHNQTMTLTVLSETEVARTRPEVTPAAPAPAVVPSIAPRAAAPVPILVKPKVPGAAPKPPVPAQRPTAPAQVRTSDSAKAAASAPAPALTSTLTSAASTTASGASPATTHGGFEVATFGYDLLRKTWNVPSLPALDSPRTLVMAFGASEVFEQREALAHLQQSYPRSIVVGCSGSGEVHGIQVKDRSISVAVTRFDKTDVKLASVEVAGSGESFSAGQTLARKLVAEAGALRGIIVLSEGLNVNGSELVRGFSSVLDESVVVTGGLSGDGTAFKRTWVSIGATPQQNLIVAIGLYGDHVRIGHGSKGGWDKFGHERIVTRSENNVLYELDGQPALALYKEYLGDKAKDLPASGLLFPLSLRASATEEKFLVRTLLAVDHEKNSMTFAGDIPKGYRAQLMRADFERLIGGAANASTSARNMHAHWENNALILAVSCVGRRLVLGDRTEEELEAVLEAFPGANPKNIAGFYSYGELSPYGTGHCDLHNQTMTLTMISESQVPLAYRSKITITPPPRANKTGDRGTREELPTTPPPPPPQAPASDHEWYADAVGLNTDLAEAVPTSILKPLDILRAERESSAYPMTFKAAGPATTTPASTPSAHVEITRIPFQGAGATQVTIERRTRGAITVVALRGRLSESFRGEELGASLTGTVVLDLCDVERITSYGVREWLSMITAAKNATLYIARCAESIVNQLTMIRKFAGTSTIISFYSPYVCGACGASFERLYDLEHDAEALRSFTPKSAKCPSCEGEGRFDDDPASYFAFVSSHLGITLPAPVREVVHDLSHASAPLQRDPIDKVIDAGVTRLRVQAKLTADFRWRRIFDGLEGKVVIDLGAVGTVSPAGATALLNALSSLDAEVESVILERCPEKFVDVFLATKTAPLVKIGSMMVEGFCTSCSVIRPTLVTASEHEATLMKGGIPTVRCRRCSGNLALKSPEKLRGLVHGESSHSTLLQTLAGADPAPIQDRSYVDATRASSALLNNIEAATLAEPTKATTRLRGAPWLIAGLFGLLALATVVYVSVLKTAHEPAAQTVLAGGSPNPAGANGAGATTAGSSQTIPNALASNSKGAREGVDAELPPGWVERGYSIENGAVSIVGHAVAVADVEEGAKLARADAIFELCKHVLTDLAGTDVYEFLAPRMHDDFRAQKEAIVLRYTSEVGTFGIPERVDTYVRSRGTSVEVHGRYRISVESYAKVVAYFRETRTFSSITVAHVFPLLEAISHSTLELVVVGLPRGHNDLVGIRVGDYVESINGRRVNSLDSFTKTAIDSWNATPPRGTLSIETEAAGAKKTNKLTKPQPNSIP